MPSYRWTKRTIDSHYESAAGRGFLWISQDPGCLACSSQACQQVLDLDLLLTGVHLVA